MEAVNTSENLAFSQTAGRSRSPLPESIAAARVAPGNLDSRLERRPSASYGHHRQTSIVHGIQHSRNTSLANSQSSASPLSPDIIAAAGISGFSSPYASGSYLDLADVNANGAVSSTYVPPALGNPVSLNHSSHPSESEGTGTMRRVERIPSRRKRREESRSKTSHSQDSRNVGEFALHHLFNSFVQQADSKIAACIVNPDVSQLRVEEICGPGADRSFDQLISALGHITRQKPKLLIDTIMYWRQKKGDIATAAKAHSNARVASQPGPHGSLLRRNTEPVQITTDNPDINGPGPSPEAIMMAERGATVSVYLVCRVLIEIFNQSDLVSITPAMAARLEDIVFGQLKVMNPDQIATSPLKLANWKIYGQLLGIMSDLNFQSVSERYFGELAKSQAELGVKSVANHTIEGRVELLILSLRHLRVKTHPDEAWSRSCSFMHDLAKLFVDSHGQRVKYAYVRIIESLLLPVAANPSVQLSSPKWKGFLDTVSPRLNAMLAKPRYWPSAISLAATLLCVSPMETFTLQWHPMCLSLQTKLKDRFARPVALQVICRLVWTYLYKSPAETQAIALRKLEDIIKIILPQGKKTHVSADANSAEPLIQLIRVIGYKQQELCFRTIIFPLINSDLFLSGKELRIEQMEPEKMVIGIRAYLAIISDLEKGEQGRPPFPQIFLDGSPLEPSPTSPGPSALAQELLMEASSPQVSMTREERLSRPVITSNFSQTSQEFYIKFCEILGKITLLCDNTFGGQAALDEKFGGLTPKTPISEAFSFSRRDEHQSIPDQKRGFYELLHVAVQALPRCLSDHIPFNSLINLLCTGTAHVQSKIAVSSVQSLKSIARQSHAQPVTIGFARFIFSFDARYSTMSDEGMLGPGHIENTLRLYVELIKIWIDEIRQRTKEVTSSPLLDGSPGRGLPLDLSSVLGHVEEIESHGLFFLCSQSRTVRAFAVTVLELITSFDTVLKRESNSRVIRILESDSEQVLNPNDEHLSIAEKSRIQKKKRKSTAKSTLIELCSSEDSYDATLWSKVFPNLIRMCFATCPFAVIVSREIVCARLLQMHNSIVTLAEGNKIPQHGHYEYANGRRMPTNTSEIMVEQWKLYLVMACTTLNNPGAQSQSQLANAQHVRKSSKNLGQSTEKISSARSLFAFVIPLLSAVPVSIRDAIVVALGSINANLYRTLLESLQYAVTTCNEEAKMRIGGHQRTPSSPQRNRRTDRLRTEVTHVYKLTSHFLKEEKVYNDDWILNNIVTYTKDLRIFLNDAEVQNDGEFQKLRRHYCGLMEELFEGINRTRDPGRWMPFESRKSAFTLMEEWCGYSPDQAQISQREETMRHLAMTQQQDKYKGYNALAHLEIEKKNLRTAALSAMASLCGGPVSLTTESGSVLSFDIRRMLSWIDIVFNVGSDKNIGSDKMHATGRRALKNLIIHNKEYPYLLERTIEMCYLADKAKLLDNYFEVVTQVLIEHKDYPLAFWKILGAVLFTLGSDKREIRLKSARLLRKLEERRQKSSKIQEYDISISDKTIAVYKLAQYEISRKLAKQHSELAFFVFSEFSQHFKKLLPDHQRNMIAAILPWIQTLELQIDPNGGPTARSYMLLANLFEITVRSSGILHHEVQALWQALATGPHAGNVQLVLDFIISLCLERREQNFVDYAKQIVVFISATPAGSKVIDFLLLQIVPRNMVQEKAGPSAPPPEVQNLPYLADLSTVLPKGTKASFSLGQVALIFLVDLMVAPVNLAPEAVPKLLHVVLTLWDHYTLVVQEHAREMLVHLIHELVVSKIDDNTTAAEKQAIEDLVEAIRQHDSKVVWDYEDNNGKEDNEAGSRVPAAMVNVTEQVVDLFSIPYPGLRDQWAKVTLSWATSCPVRHLACRSFQIFRCISISLDSMMLADMLARLSNTIADSETDYRTFSLEILTTLKIIIGALQPVDLLRYPQLFWTTCACLDTIHEREFLESLGMLEKLLEKLDMADNSVVAKLVESKPPRWEGDFEGLQPLVYKGLKSADAFERTLVLLDKLADIPNNALTGDNARLLFAILANLPGFLQAFEDMDLKSIQIRYATKIARIAEEEGCNELAQVLDNFLNDQYENSGSFLADMIASIRHFFFPSQDFGSLVFMMGLLTNTTEWFRLKTIDILCAMLPEVDMRKQDFASHGSDLIQPLLRLLQTNLCPQALIVMDHIMTVSANPMEKHHLRMSMASSASRGGMRKEYDRTQSLYGIPEQTGWSIPMPAIHSNKTRNNVHAVFYTCADATILEAQAAATPEVDFHPDGYQDSYFPVSRSNTMKSVDTQETMIAGDLATQLDSLDDFFDDVMTPEPIMFNTASSPNSDFAPDYRDANEHYYDQQTAPILRQTLTRTASSSSFHNGLSESRPSTSHTNHVMTPTAFAAPTSNAAIPARPTMHARSATTPANNLPQSVASGSLLPASDEVSDEFFSDDDRLLMHANSRERENGNSSYSVESLMRSTRAGMRRLTGNSSRESGSSAVNGNGRQRDNTLLRAQQRAATQTANSPKVPKVPAEYLTGSPTSPGG